MQQLRTEPMDDGGAPRGSSRPDLASPPSADPPLRLTPEESGILHTLALEMEAEGKSTRTFRRLEPARQAGIVDEVLKEAIRSGDGGVAMRSVAGRLGISVATLYTYFADRDAMLEFATRLAVRISLMSPMEESAAGTSADLAEDLRAHLSTDLGYVAEHWSIAKYCWQAGYRGGNEASRSVMEPVAQVMRSRVRRLLAEAEERGEMRTDLDGDVAARVVNAMLLVVADARFVDHLNDYLQLYPDDGADPDETVAVAVEIITRGVCRRGRRATPHLPTPNE
jgi:AcrR family transcriptional regulator